MPALSETQEAAIKACVALLEAFDAGRSAAESRRLLRRALESAMLATGFFRDESPDADALVDRFINRNREAT